MVSDELIDKLAMLSRLQFKDAEKVLIKNDLEKMISFINKLNELDTSGVQPLIHMSEEVNIFRKDEVEVMCTTQEALVNAPVKDNTFFKVPKVIKSK